MGIEVQRSLWLAYLLFGGYWPKQVYDLGKSTRVKQMVKKKACKELIRELQGQWDT